MLPIILFSAALFGLLFTFSYRKKRVRKQMLEVPFPPEWEDILNQKVQFYAALSEQDKLRFQHNVKQFLSVTTISGVKGLEVTETLRMLVASSAIIPVFLFDDWEYPNLNHVLIYDGPVDPRQVNDAETEGILLGQVRRFQNEHILLLSRQALENGFVSMNGKSNVGFHEFAHLIDELDGTMDGIPKVLMPEELLSPWTKVMYTELERIRSNHSDINSYALTSHAEFFAVVCEYFFENPEGFKEKHPELYRLMNTIFRKSPLVQNI